MTAAGPSRVDGIRITRGAPDEAEVAAVTVALLAVAAAGDDGPDDGRRPATWTWRGE